MSQLSRPDTSDQRLEYDSAQNPVRPTAVTIPVRTSAVQIPTSEQDAPSNENIHSARMSTFNKLQILKYLYLLSSDVSYNRPANYFLKVSYSRLPTTA